jgi:hypothetical protein
VLLLPEGQVPFAFWVYSYYYYLMPYAKNVFIFPTLYFC